MGGTELEFTSVFVEELKRNRNQVPTKEKEEDIKDLKEQILNLSEIILKVRKENKELKNENTYLRKNLNALEQQILFRR